MTISAVRSQDWGVQYLDESGQWMQTSEVGTASSAPSGAAANDEAGNALTESGWSDSTPAAAIASVVNAAGSYVQSISTLGPSEAAAIGATQAAPTPAPAPTDASAVAASAPVAPGPAASTSTASSATASPAPIRTPEEWAAISAAWSEGQTDFYRLYQQMSEHGWTAVDIAHVSGMTEQQVGDYLTRHGAPAGGGGAVTLGRDAVDAPFLAALAAAEANPPSSPDASRPWWNITTTAPAGSTLDESGTLIFDESGVHPATTFDLAAFTTSYESQGTAAAQDFARIQGAFTVDSSGALNFASGASLVVSYTEAGAIAPAELDWVVDSRIAAYDSYAKGNALTIGAMQAMVDTHQNQQIIQLFGTSATVAPPDNEFGERMRAMYGTDLATEMLKLTVATDAMKARYLDDLNAALATPGVAGAGQAVAPWWTQQATQYDESGQPLAPQYAFNASAYQAWYTSQPDAQHQLIGMVYGTSAASTGSSGLRTTGATDSLSLQFSTDESGRSVASDVTLSSDLVRVDLSNAPDLYDNSGIYFLPSQGFVTAAINVKPETDFFDELLPIIIIAAVSYFSAGTLGPAAAGAMGLTETTVAAGVATTALTTTGMVVSAAVAGAATSMVSGMLNDNLSLKGILQGALSGALTAGLAQGLGIAGAVPSGGGIVSTAAGIVERATIQGTVQALMGGSFTNGAIAGLASGVAGAVNASINTNINSGIVEGLQNGSMSASEAITARYFQSMLNTAVNIVATGSSAPGHDFAVAFLDSTFGLVGSASQVSSSSTIDPTTIGTTGQVLPTVAGVGSAAQTADSAAPDVATDPAPEPAPESDPVETAAAASAASDPALIGATAQAAPTTAADDDAVASIAQTPAPTPEPDQEEPVAWWTATSNPAPFGTTGQATPGAPAGDDEDKPVAEAPTSSPAPDPATADIASSVPTAVDALNGMFGNPSPDDATPSTDSTGQQAQALRDADATHIVQAFNDAVGEPVDRGGDVLVASNDVQDPTMPQVVADAGPASETSSSIQTAEQNQSAAEDSRLASDETNSRDQEWIAQNDAITQRLGDETYSSAAMSAAGKWYQETGMPSGGNTSNFDPANPLTVPDGQITFNAEGNDNPNSRYFSRQLHWPGGVSGVTIGRGYDMGGRSVDQVMQDLTDAGVPLNQAAGIAAGAGLTGTDARDFVSTNKSNIGTISQESQYNLFVNSTYQKYSDAAANQYNSATQANSNAPAWNDLDSKVRDIAVDLTYQQGRIYNSQMPNIVSNDKNGLAQSITDDSRTSKYETGRQRASYLRKNQP